MPIVSSDDLDKHLEATGAHLGVESKRYGGGFTAILASSEATSFLFDMLSSDDNDVTRAQKFISDNRPLPAAWGDTAIDAMAKLDRKLGVLYQ